MEVVLDTSFIISCIRKRIDFISQLKELGFKIVIPKEVSQELKGLKKGSKSSHDDRVAIDLAFEMFTKEKVKKMSLGGRNVDEELIRKGKEGVYIGTLDAGIKRNVPNRIVINTAKARVEVERS